VYNFFDFFGGAWYKDKKLTMKHTKIPHGRATRNRIPIDDTLIPDLPRGRGKSIGGDLDVGEKGSG
jgi:hypothetical protein